MPRASCLRRDGDVRGACDLQTGQATEKFLCDGQSACKRSTGSTRVSVSSASSGPGTRVLPAAFRGSRHTYTRSCRSFIAFPFAHQARCDLGAKASVWQTYVFLCSLSHHVPTSIVPVACPRLEAGRSFATPAYQPTLTPATKAALAHQGNEKGTCRVGIGGRGRA